MTESSKYLLWGSAGHAKVLAELITLLGGLVIALFDNRKVPSALEGIPVFFGDAGFQRWVEINGDLQNVAGLAAIGGSRGRDRLAIQDMFRRHGITTPSVVHPSAVVSSTTLLGEGCQVLALANVAADVRLGEGCIINHCASIDHECNVGNGVHIAPRGTLCGCVTIGDNVFVGAGAVVLPRISIGAGAVVGAGAIVTRDVPPSTTVIGCPAKPIRTN